MIIGYLRVSTGHQTLENQRNEVEKYAVANGLTIDKWVTEVVSGKKKGKDRKLGGTIKKLKPGDTVIVTELSRLSRTLLDIMTIVGELLKRNIRLYSIKEGISFDDSINSKVLVFAFGLVAEIERNLISMRTKEALELRRSKGVKLGRPVGSSTKSALLSGHAEQIRKMIAAGASPADICKKFGVSYSTLYRWLKMTGNGYH